MKTKSLVWIGWFAVALAMPRAARADLVAVGRDDFCVTSGSVEPLADGRLRVSVGGMRGVAARGSGFAAELRVTARGKSRDAKPLADGELRRQIGLKLRAQDTCNLVYVMWHLDPKPGLYVSVKRNPGQSRHAQCGDRGYINLRPPVDDAPNLADGREHVLRAAIRDRTLDVSADGKVVWSGVLPPQAFEFDGPAGVRSDNGTFDFTLLTSDARKAPCQKPD